MSDGARDRLVVRGVARSFGATRALSGVDMEARAGEVHAIVGENGAGKSTLMKILAGAIAPDEGSIALDGAPFRPRDPAAARGAGVALVSQELALCPHLTVAENVTLGREPMHRGALDAKEEARVARDALAQVGRADLPLGTRVGALPIAEQQLVEIARALTLRCKVLILDEPTSSLAREDVTRLFDRVRALRERGVCVLYISHFLEEVRAIADRFTVLRDGKTSATGDVKSTTDAEIVRAMAGRSIDALFPPSAARRRGEPILEVRDLAGAAKPARASLVLHRGEVLGVAGLVGAGRTELLRCVFGLDAVKRGTVRVKAFTGAASPRAPARSGRGARERGSKRRRARARSVDRRQRHALQARRARPAALRHPRRGSGARRRSGSNGSPSRRRAHRQAVRDLSGGNQQKVALARLLHHDVDVLLLDEPTRGIDVGSKAQIYALIDSLASQGKAVLLVSSYLPELLGVCDRIAVMCTGVLGAARAARDWTEHALLEEATGSAQARSGDAA